MNLDKVYIKWIDSGMHFDYGWKTKDDYLKGLKTESMVAHTMGFIMDESDDIIAIAQSYDEHNDTWYAVQIIARQNIIEMQYLEG